jgi:hypothetical protein
MAKKATRRSRVRKQPPTMDAIAIKWMIGYARRNLWRVESGAFDFHDLIQEGHYCWQYVLNKYPKAKDPPHLMALFKLTYCSHITNLANKRTKQQTIQTFFAIEPNEMDLPGNLRPLLADAPYTVKQVLTLFTSAKSLTSLRAPSKRRKNGTRETFNDRLCRLAGFPSSIDLVSELHEYFSPH